MKSKLIISILLLTGLFSCSENRLSEPVIPLQNNTFTSFETGKTENISFPHDWFGEWKGTCNMFYPGKTGSQDKFEMRLNVEAETGSKNWKWQIIYKSPKLNQVRDYELIPVNPSAGHYAVDEKNGIILDTFILNKNLMMEQFSVENSNITVKHNLTSKNRMQVEFMTFSNQSMRDSGTQNYKVRSFKLMNYQDCSLRK